MNKGWRTKKLGELCEIELGRTPARANSAFWDEKRVTENVWLSIADLLKAEDNIVVDSKEYISDKGARICKLVPKGTLLVSFKLTLGRLAFAGCDLFTNEAIAALTIVNERELSKEFLFYFLHFFDWVKAAGDDVKLKGMTLNKAKLKEIQVHFPETLAEQRRIVGLMDEVFERLATAQANYEKNIQSARAIFESHLQSVFSQRGVGWERVTLETLLERGWIESHLDGNHGSDYPRKDEFIDEGVPYISANCLDDDRVDMARAKYLAPRRAALLRKGIAKDNDVLFAHNATVGPVAILHTDADAIILSTSLTYYRCNSRHIIPEYLAHYMRSFEFKSQYLQVMRQSTRNQVPITKQREFFHVVPPLVEQKEIVKTLDRLFEDSQSLAHLFQRKLDALEALKRSLLHQAFTGQLPATP
jgi:type I restriction enzyme S subunit